jgi:hypothetical protein
MNQESVSFLEQFKRLTDISEEMQKGNITDVDQIVNLVQESTSIYSSLKPRIKNALERINELKAEVNNIKE